MWIGLNKRKMSKGKQDGFRSAHTQIHIKLLGIQWQDANTICNESQSPKGRKTKSLLLKNTIVSDNETWAEMSPLFLQITWYHIISKVHDDIFTINTRLIFAGLLLIMYFSCFHHMRNKAKKKKKSKHTHKNKKPSDSGTAIRVVRKETKYVGSPSLGLQLHGLQGTWSWDPRLQGFTESTDRVSLCYKIGSYSVPLKKLDYKI